MSDKHEFDVFISYARKDGLEYAERLEFELNKTGFSTFLDRNQLDPNQDFTAGLERAIENSQFLLCCLTPDTKRDKSFVRRELLYAIAHNKHIIPLKFEGSIVPHIHIIELTYIDFVQQSFSNGLNELIQRLHKTKSGEFDERTKFTPPDDLFRDYCNGLYRFIVKILNKKVISILPLPNDNAVISLNVSDTPEAVPEKFTPMIAPSRMVFSYLAGIEENNEPNKFNAFFDAFEHYEGRILLLGEAGSGKTTTLFSFVRDAIVNRLNDPDEPLPILLPVSTWNIEHASILDWILDAEPELEKNKSQIKQLIEYGKILFALDGLDELGDEREKKQSEGITGTYDPRPLFVENVIATLNTNRVVVSCRIKDYDALAKKSDKISLNGAITLQPLDDTQLKTYLHDLPELWNVLQSDDDLRDVARTPLLLSFFTFAFNGLNVEAKALRDLSGGELRDKIFETYIHRRYHHEERKYTNRGELPPFTITEVYDVLGYMAMVKMPYGRGDNRFSSSDVPIEDPIQDDFINFMMTLHLLVQKQNEKFYSFVHLLLRDYFAYQYSTAHLLDIELYNNSRQKNPVVALKLISDIRIIPKFIDLLENSETQPEIRRYIAFSLSVFNTPETQIILKKLIKDKDYVVRAGCIQSLGEYKEIDLIPSLEVGLRDRNQEVRMYALQALSKFHTEAVFDLIIAGLKDKGRFVRRTAAEILGEWGDKRAIDPLIATLKDSNVEVLDSVTQALSYFKSEKIAPALINLLDDYRLIMEVVQFNHLVADRLEEIGTPKALQAIEEARGNGWL